MTDDLFKRWEAVSMIRIPDKALQLALSLFSLLAMDNLSACCRNHSQCFGMVFSWAVTQS
jgi:hypothetical protein